MATLRFILHLFTVMLVATYGMGAEAAIPSTDVGLNPHVAIAESKTIADGVMTLAQEEPTQGWTAESLMALGMNDEDALFWEQTFDTTTMVVEVVGGVAVVVKAGTRTVLTRADDAAAALADDVVAPNTGLPSSYTRNADGTISGPGNLSSQQAVFRETGEVAADGGAILQRESGGYYTIDANGNQQYIPVAELPTNLQTRGETPWQQSQTYIQDQVGGGEVSYLNGVEVPHGTPGSVRPDAVPNCGTQCFEVKNYDLSTPSGTNSLVNVTVGQINDRAVHLPAGMQQRIEIDITGQNVPRTTQEAIADRIVQESGGAVALDDINFFERN